LNFKSISINTITSFIDDIPQGDGALLDNMNGVCDICGKVTSNVRIVVGGDFQAVDELCGFTCKECYDKEETYMDSLVTALNNQPDLIDKYAKKFQKVRIKMKGALIANYGLVDDTKKCSLCKKHGAYLCVVENDEPNITVKSLDELSDWYCIDCVSLNNHYNDIEEKFLDYIMFKETLDELMSKVRDDTFSEHKMSAADAKVLRDDIRKMMVIGTKYKTHAEVMEKARRAYLNVPLKIIIRAAEEGEVCSICGAAHTHIHDVDEDA
jgi:hypothetical protein